MKGLLRSSHIQVEDILDKLLKAKLADKLDQLPETEQKILRRMEYADECMRDGGKYMRYKILLKEMERRFADHCVSTRTLENDIARAKKFFNSRYSRDDKEYARGTRTEWLNRIAAKAEKDGDWRGAVAAIKEGNEIQALKEKDIDLPDYTKFQPQPILVITDPAQIGLPIPENLEEQLKILRGSKESYLKFNSDDIDDAEEVDEDE